MRYVLRWVDAGCSKPLTRAVLMLVCTTLTGGLYAQDSSALTDAWNSRAAANLNRQLDTSFHYAQLALQQATRTGYAKGRATAWLILGDHFALRSNPYLSVRYYMDALQAFRKLGDESGAGLVYAALSTHQQQACMSYLPQEYIHMALQRTVPAGDSLRALVLTRFAEAKLEEPAQQDSVSWAIGLARQYSGRARDNANLLHLQILDARLALRHSDTATARAMLSGIIANARSQGLNLLALQACRLMAETSAQNESYAWRAEMIRYAIAGGYRELMTPDAILLYDWHRHHHRPDSALPYSRLLLDILNRKNTTKSSGEMDYIDYYTQQQAMQSLELKRSSQQQVLLQKQQETRERRLEFLFLGILLVLTGLLGSYFFRSYRISHLNAALLAEKNRESRNKHALLLRNDDFKNKLVSIVAHDFRGPLNNIVHIMDFLQGNLVTPEEAAGWMKQLEKSTTDTLQTFDNILAWINSQLAGFEYAPGPCFPAEMLPAALRHSREQLAEKKVRVQIDVPDTLCVLADHEMLQFVHRNLIHNAIKFSPAGGTLYISATVGDGSALLSVRDEGPGIPDNILPYLFEYSHADEKRSSSQAGTGLALIICSDFMDKMGGRLTATNPPGGGAMLTYEIPLCIHKQNRPLAATF